MRGKPISNGRKRDKRKKDELSERRNKMEIHSVEETE